MTENPTTIDQARAALQSALAEAQAEFPTIPRDRTVKVETRTGGSYSFAYAPLDTIVSAVRPVLAKHGLAIVQRLESPAGVPSLRTELLHKDGGAIASSFPLGDWGGSPQQLGSLLTYLRRYALSALLGVAAEEDNDVRDLQQGRKPAQDAPSSPVPDEDVSRSEESPFQQPQLRADDTGAQDLSDPQRRKIYALRKKLTDAELLSDEAWSTVLSADYGTEKISELTKAQASHLIERLVKLEGDLVADE